MGVADRCENRVAFKSNQEDSAEDARDEQAVVLVHSGWMCLWPETQGLSSEEKLDNYDKRHQPMA